MKRKNQTILITTVVLLTANLLSGCVNFGSTPTIALAVDNHPANTETNAVSASGEVIPDKWVSLGFSGGGKNLGVFVNPGDIVSEGKLLAEVDHIDAKAALENARAQLASAKSQLERLKDLDDVSGIDMAAAEAAVTAAEAGVDYTYASWMSTYLYAPFGGTIVDVSGHDGESALPGQQVFLLADLTTLEVVTTDMSEVDIVHVKVGNAAEVSFDAFPDITTTGRVARIGSSKSSGSGVYYKITITLDSIPDELRWGMSAFVEILVDYIVSTSTPTMTNTTTPTSTPTPTPTLGSVLYKTIVLTADGTGVNLRDEPEGEIIEVLVDGTRLEVYMEEKLSDGTIWLKVRTEDDVLGWIIMGASATLTPTPTPTITSTKKTVSAGGGGGGDVPPDLPPDTTIPPGLTQPPVIP